MPLKRTLTSPESLSTSQSQRLLRAKSHHHFTTTSTTTSASCEASLISHGGLLTPQASTRVMKEDPFNLSSFFPSSVLAGGEEEEWNWIEAEEEHVKQTIPAESYLLGAGYGNSEEEPDALVVEVGESGEEELMRLAIKKEDKLGILDFSLKRDASSDDNRLLSPYSDEADEAVDDEALYLRLCSRRAAASGSSSSRDNSITKFDELFFPAGVEEETPSLLTRVVTAVM